MAPIADSCLASWSLVWLPSRLTSSPALGLRGGVRCRRSLPFQTGFRLAPDIGARWTDLSFWKIVVDTTVLTSLPLIVASVGGTMCSVRFTMRQIVVAVAVIAIVLGVLVNFGRRVGASMTWPVIIGRKSWVYQYDKSLIPMV